MILTDTLIQKGNYFHLDKNVSDIKDLLVTITNIEKSCVSVDTKGEIFGYTNVKYKHLKPIKITIDLLVNLFDMVQHQSGAKDYYSHLNETEYISINLDSNDFDLWHISYGCLDNGDRYLGQVRYIHEVQNYINLVETILKAF